MPTIIRMSQTVRKVGLSRSSVYLRMKAGDFPKPVRLGNAATAVGFIESEVDDWIQRQVAQSRAEPTTVKQGQTGSTDVLPKLAEQIK